MNSTQLLLLQVLCCASFIISCNNNRSNIDIYDGNYKTKYSNVGVCSTEIRNGGLIRFKTNNEKPIGNVENLEVHGDVYLVSSQSEPVIAFDKNGNEKFRVGGWGSGPGEYSHNYKFDVNESGDVAVIDRLRGRINIYENHDKYSKTIRLKELGVDRTSVDISDIYINDDKDIYLLNVQTNGFDASVLKVSSSGLLFERGSVPLLAGLGKFLGGGSITASPSGDSLFYSYLAGDEIFSRLSNGDPMAVYQEEPQYFTNPDISNIREILSLPLKYQSKPLINEAHSNTLVYGVEYLDTGKGIILQNIASPISTDQDRKFFIEAWTKDGTKIAQSVEIPSILVEAHDNYIYTTHIIDSKNDLYGVRKSGLSFSCL